MARLKELLTEAYHTVRCAGGWSFLAVETAAFATPAVVFTFLPNGAGPAYRIGRAWGKLNLWIMNGELDVHGLDKIVEGQPYVVMSNHRSHLDVWAVTTVLPMRLSWVMKQELRKIPVFGYACERLEQVYVKRGNSESARRSMALAAERIAAGRSVVFFPEGTRSRTTRLGPFKTGGFRLALMAQVPILPVSVTGTEKMLPPDTWKFYAGRATLVIGDPIPTTGLDLDDMPDLMARTRNAIRAGLTDAGADDDDDDASAGNNGHEDQNDTRAPTPKNRNA